MIFTDPIANLVFLLQIPHFLHFFFIYSNSMLQTPIIPDHLSQYSMRMMKRIV